MNEQRKLLIVFVIGILLGFGGGRLLPISGDASLTPRYGEGATSAEDNIAEQSIAVTTDNPNLTATAEPIISSQPAAISATTPAAAVVAKLTDLSVETLDQPAGSLVIVKRASLARPGWVVIHEDRAGIPGNVLGAALFDRGASMGTVELLRATVSGGLYYAMLHDDDGDHLFELKQDLPLRATDGASISSAFRAL
ncbi:MAG: hypothetical protein HYS59_00650 [Candidatus Vogelbacteria bacterium]|nr:hypothetical protein [Candidatus Vogelbacteria bacterium]